MTVERETVVRLAHAEMNDEYGVDFDLLGRRAALTASEAIEIAGELVQAAYDALKAAHDNAAEPAEPAAFDLGFAAEQIRRIGEFGGAL